MGSRVITEAVSEFQSGGERAAGQYLEDLHVHRTCVASCLIRRGTKISGRMVFPWIEDMRRTGHVRRHSSLDASCPSVSYAEPERSGPGLHSCPRVPPGPRVFGPHGIPALALPLQLFRRTGVLFAGLVADQPGSPPATCYAAVWRRAI